MVKPETKRAAESLCIALLVGVLHLAVLSGRFSTEQGRGGVTWLLGCTLITGVLWTVLALRSLANDAPLGPAVTDGLTAMAVSAGVIALLPPRAANFSTEGSVDDFTTAYLPMSFLAVVVTLLTQVVWKKREPQMVWWRLMVGVATCCGVLLVCIRLG